MKSIWLDVDPGHDDATAIMLAVNLPNITLLGVSSTHGNAPAEFTALNAARCLFAFGVQPGTVFVYPGADKPLLLPAKHDPEIHGIDGLGGVEGLPAFDDPRLNGFFQFDGQGKHVRALDGMSKHIREAWNGGKGEKVVVISTGPMTNIALFVSVYPDLLDAVEEFVFMGGGVGMGNRSATGEFNILCDPHACQIVLDCPVKTTMMPINVTHTAIVTREIHQALVSPSSRPSSPPDDPLPKAETNLRHTLSTVISYFAAAYKLTFGFANGPPLHDALTVVYVSNPELFKTKRHRVDCELTGTHTMGETVVDVWNYKQCDDSWGRTGKNCVVAESLDVKAFFDLLLECVARCDKISPLNAT